MNITIVEDEPKLAGVLKDYLHRDGYEVSIYSEGNQALAALQNEIPDLVLLDLMLPGLDGMSICKELRKTSNVPVIMLTARIEEIDRLLGLELGADDYICKPFSPREVVARVKAVLRRAAMTRHIDSTSASNSSNEGTSEVSGTSSAYRRIQLSEDTATISIKDKTCSLTAVELRLLQTLYARPGIIFNRSQLMRHMYEDNRIVSDRTIDSHVKKLRQKLELLDSSNQYIHSVYGIGYKFEIIEVDE